MCNYHAEFGGSICLTVYAKEEENPQNWGPLGPHRLGMEGVLAT